MNKRGLVIALVGLVLVEVSLSFVTSTVSSIMNRSNNFSITTLFEDVFDEISNEIQIMPDDSIYVSYDTSISNTATLGNSNI